MNSKIKNVLKYTLSVALAGVLLWLAFRSVDWTAFLEGLKVTRWEYLVPFFAASVCALVLRTFRWRLLLVSSGYRSGWLAVWDANNAGNLANVAIPGFGEFLRCGYVAGKYGYGNVLGTILMERIWDFLAVLVMSILALVLDRTKLGSFFAEQVWKPMAGNLNISLGWVVALIVLLAVLFFRAVFRFRERNGLCRKIAGGLSSVGRGFVSFGRMERKGVFLLYSAGIFLIYVMMCYSIQKAMPELSGLGLKDALFFTVIGNVASIIPVPGGIGAYHYLMALSASSLYGMSWETGILFATLQHELHAVLVLILGTLSYMRLSLRSRNQRA